MVLGGAAGVGVAEMSCGEMSAVRQRGCGATSGGRYYVAKRVTGSRRVRAGDGAGACLDEGIGDG